MMSAKPTMKWSEKDLVHKWGQSLPPHVQRRLPWEVLSELVSGLSDDTKLPRDVLHGIIRSQDVSGLFQVASSLDVTEYTSADLLLQDRQTVELFSKFNFPDSPFNKRERALLRFHEAEERCRETNFRVGRSLELTGSRNAVIHRAIRIIERILGGFRLNAMLKACRFGPGASLCVKGPFTTEYFKLSQKEPTVSTDAFPYAEALLAYDRKWCGFLMGINPLDIVGDFSCFPKHEGPELRISDHNKAAFVPKNAKTERSIAIEPYFNVYFQLGLGGLIRSRLYDAAGVNLDSQLRNQALALKGSITGKLATIDFSMASDTIARETVRLLIPPEWFIHLDRLRSKNYLMDGAIRPWEKFSSMGNGFTFELETLIFYAIAVASCDELGVSSEDVTVFGDDVVLPTEVCAVYQDVCGYLGFKVNDEKSFTSGPFRESCGEDYLGGVRVRPVFCKELSTVQDVASLLNRLMALNRACGDGSRCNDPFNAVGRLLLQRIPADVRAMVVGPPSEDTDGYIHTTCLGLMSKSPLVKWNRSLYCWSHPTIRFRPKVLQRRDDAVALFAHWSTAVKQNAINAPVQTAVIEGLQRLTRYQYSEISDFVRETTPRQITGRKIGKLSMGQNLVWSLGSDLQV